jgi:1,4-alpha-glucan branching enzyme
MAVKKPARKNPKQVKDLPKRIGFEFSAPEAHEVFLAGEFNGWDIKSTPMKKDENGIWKTIISLAPGRYEYRYLSDGNWKNDRSCSGCVPNSFGSLNCVKMVE